MRGFLEEVATHEWLAVPLCILVLFMGAAWGLWCVVTGTEHHGIVR